MFNFIPGDLLITVAITLLVVLLVSRSVRLIPQGEAAVIERLGRYVRTVEGGLTLLIPFIDRIRAKVDTRERVVSFPPQPVITQENVTVGIDVVVTFQINDPARAIYGVDNYIYGVEQITVATLRDVVGGMTLEDTLVSREMINRRLRGELDAATTKWGLRISRVELKAIDPPTSIQQAMEMQMKAEREKRATILNAEGQREADIKTAEGLKQAKILSAEGDKHASILAAEAQRQSEILRAEGERAARYLRSQGEARAIMKVNAAIKSARITPEVLAYQYLEKLPAMAEGSANKTWVIPAQFGDALSSFANSLATPDKDGTLRYEPTEPTKDEEELAHSGNTESWFSTGSAPEIAAAVAAANAEAKTGQPDALPVPVPPSELAAAEMSDLLPDRATPPAVAPHEDQAQ